MHPITPAKLALYNPTPNAVVIEPGKGPWQNSVHWGNSLSNPMPKSEGVVQSVFETDELPGPPRVMVVNLFRSDRQAGGNNFNADIRARITVGCGAKQNEFDCDWTQGTQFAVTANYVRVNILSYAPSGDLAYDATDATPFTVGAMIAEGNAAKTKGLTYTEPQIEISHTVAPTHRFDTTPDFAQGYILHVTKSTGLPIAAGDARVIFFAGNIQLAVYDATMLQNYLDQGIQIPGACTGAQVAAIASDIITTPQWVLAL